MSIWSDDRKVEAYSVGIMSASVCAVKELTCEEVCEVLNTISPTGISSEWQPTKDEFFAIKGAGGQQHKIGCVCESDAGRRHWLFEC